MMSKKAQIWYTDFMVGLMIFVIVIFIYFQFAHLSTQDPNKVSAELVMDAKTISSSLVTKGSPEDWDRTTVDIIGLTDGNQRIVDSKLDQFTNMSYSETKTKLRTPYDYYMYFEDFEGTRILIDGENGTGVEPVNYDNLVSITRVVIHDSELIRMVVHIWQ